MDEPNHEQDATGGQNAAGEELNTGMPRPSDTLPALSGEQRQMLRRVGQEWTRASAGSEAASQALPVDPNLGRFPPVTEIQPTGFDRLVHVTPLSGRPPGEVVPDSAPDVPPSGPGRLLGRARRAVLGAPLKSTALAMESMRKLVALPVLSADALSSVAYGPEALLAVLVLAGTAGLGYSLPVAATIAFLMLAVGVSYRQTIRAYPRGGGSYIVASDNLGRVPGLLAAAGLMIDYVLTVAVSIASGVAALTSAIPSLADARVPLGLCVIAFLLAGNLRGVRQAGVLFAIPTYAFILAICALITTSLVTLSGNGFSPETTPHPQATEGVGLLLIMRAFASGSTAMTGIEAISNAVPAFHPVRWRNARATLTWMIVLLVTLFAGTITVVHLSGIVPNHQETVLSQLAHLSFGSGPMYYFVQAATAAVLLLAANTAYNDFPRVLFLLARDFHAPRVFLRLGDRLSFSNGIALLSVAAALVYVAFDGSTAFLIPLYAVGVFLAFTLSQAGMVVHWHRVRGGHWRKRLIFNATGAVLTGLVLITAGITKFTSGAWVALLAIGLFLLLTTRIRRYYDGVAKALRLHPNAIEVPALTVPPPPPPPSTTPAPQGAAPPEAPPESDAGPSESYAGRAGQGAESAAGVPLPAVADREEEEIPEALHHLSLVTVASLDLAGLRALAYAASLQQPTLALHVSPSEEEAQRFCDDWNLWGNHVPLEVVVSPYRAIVTPLVHYIEALHRQRPDLTVTVVLPEIVPRHARHRFLHSRIAARLRRALRSLPKLVVTTVPFHV